MIVATLDQKRKGRVILQKDHASVALQIAEAFGNDLVLPPEPRDLMLFLARYHDNGWDKIDSKMLLNPETGLPYNLVQTPFLDLLATGPASVDFNERFHPLCGLLASMHVWGLYNGRYGLSDKIVVDLLPEDKRMQTMDMLDTEIARQQNLKVLLQDTEWSKYCDDGEIFTLYKQLQFFDTLSLYFNELGESKAQASVFKNVPSIQGDLSIQIQPIGPNTFELHPFPFKGASLTIKQDLYEVPIQFGFSTPLDLKADQKETHTYTLVAKDGN